PLHFLLFAQTYLPYFIAFTDFLPAIATAGPLRVRAFEWVLWPLTGRPLRCRTPRLHPRSTRRLILKLTSRRRSPSTRRVRSIISRIFATSASVNASDFLFRSTSASAKIFFDIGRPTPNI